jgi:hypothetical protein
MTIVMMDCRRVNDDIYHGIMNNEVFTCYMFKESKQWR